MRNMDNDRRFYERPAFWPRLIGGIFLLIFVIAFHSEVFILIRLILAIFQMLLLRPINALPPETPQALFTLLANLIIYVTCYFVLLKWISLFVLPSKDAKERKQVYQRLVDYVFGLHGAAMFVKNGELITHKNEDPEDDRVKARFPSLAFIDMASAVVSESRSLPPIIKLPKKSVPPSDRPSPIRALGPGIAFLRSGERIRGSVDLRKQFRMIRGVRGFTSDGIELETNVNAIFTLGQPHDVMMVFETKDHGLGIMSVDPDTRTISISDKIDEADAAEIRSDIQNHMLNRTSAFAAEGPYSNRPPYLFDEERIISAVISQPRNTRDGKVEKWSDLPAQVAVSLLLDELSRISYDDLYSLDSPEPDCYLYDTFKPEFQRIMKGLGVLSYQFAQRKDGRVPQQGDIFNPNEYVFRDVKQLHNPKPMRDRGIKVIEVGFSDFKPIDATIPEQRFDTWRSRWQKEIEITNAGYDLEVMHQLNHSRAQAQREIIHNLSQIFKLPGFTQDAMAIRIFQALESAATNPATNRLLPRDTVDMLKSFQNILFPPDRSGQSSGRISAPDDNPPPDGSR
jgi:hypothetical protein